MTSGWQSELCGLQRGWGGVGGCFPGETLYVLHSLRESLGDRISPSQISWKPQI